MDVLGPIKALYIHIPFCQKRCYYCDFISSSGASTEKMREYTNVLIQQITALANRVLLDHIETIYIGGGTPSYLEYGCLRDLLNTLHTHINFNQLKEFSFEANPESLDENLIHLLIEHKISRVSLGVQSFIPEELKAIGRVHTKEKALMAMTLLERAHMDYSIDLMCGLPHQSTASFMESLSILKRFHPSHVSVYPLTIEDDTVLAQRILESKIEEPSDDFEAEALMLASECLKELGIHRYEIASYAIKGHESIHNSAYWSATSYLGIGSGAASMLYVQDVEAVFEALCIELPELIENDTKRIRFSFGKDSAQQVVNFEQLNTREMIAEDLMLAFRKTSGISFENLEKYQAMLPSMKHDIDACLKECLRLNLLEKTQEFYIPAEKAWLLGNELFGRLWDLHESTK